MDPSLDSYISHPIKSGRVRSKNASGSVQGLFDQRSWLAPLICGHLQGPLIGDYRNLVMALAGLDVFSLGGKSTKSLPARLKAFPGRPTLAATARPTAVWRTRRGSRGWEFGASGAGGSGRGTTGPVNESQLRARLRHLAGATPVSRSAPMPKPRCYCGRGTAISMGMAMGRLVKA